jgi:hypothetical protein
MLSYGHPNSRIHPPVLNAEQQQLYHTLRNGGIVRGSAENPKYLAADLGLIAEKLRCDAAIARIGKRIPWLTSGCSHPEYFSAAVSLAAIDVTSPPEICGMFAVDSDAGNRIADRLDSGMTPLAAVLKTLAQCEQPTLTEREVRRLERQSEVYVRHLSRCGRDVEQGSMTQAEACRRADIAADSV